MDEGTVYIRRLAKNFDIASLDHITHIDNLPSIFARGLLPFNEVKYIIRQDISIPTVQDRRERLEPIFHRSIHDYVPLYFNVRNPMLYSRIDMQESIVVLELSVDVLSKPNILFTDGNAAVRTYAQYNTTTSFYSNLKDLDKLNWDCIWDEYWNNYPDGKRIRCAEVLIPDKIETQFINKIHVYPRTLKSSMSMICNIAEKYKIPYEIDEDYNFFFEENIQYI